MPKLFLGPYAKCCCCDKTSPVRLCSVIGPVVVKNVQVSHALLNRIFRDVSTRVYGDTRMRKVRDASNPLGIRKLYTFYRFDCPKCAVRSTEVYWVETSTDNWIGGWCKHCLHLELRNGTFGHPEEGASHDMNILCLAANRKTAATLSAWHEAWQLVENVVPEEPALSEEEQLF